jgi:hypothetical protein
LALIARLPTHHGKPPPRMSQATESLFTENHEYFFNSIGRARNAGKGEQAKSYHRIFDLGKNRKLYIFAACVFLFQFADASLLPIVGQNLAQSATEYASVLMAGLTSCRKSWLRCCRPGWVIIPKSGAESHCCFWASGWKLALR